MNSIEAYTDEFKILTTCEFTPSVMIECIGRDYRNSETFTATYVFEITPDMKFNLDGVLHPVVDEMIGFWSTGSIIRFNRDGDPDISELENDLQRCIRKEIKSYSYEEVYDSVGVS